MSGREHNNLNLLKADFSENVIKKRVILLQCQQHMDMLQYSFNKELYRTGQFQHQMVNRLMKWTYPTISLDVLLAGEDKKSTR